MKTYRTRFPAVVTALTCCLVLSLFAAPSASAQANIVVVPGAGFADPTVVAPVGGNPGGTVGQQRLNVFFRAAQIWGALLNSPVPVNLQASFVPLFCSPGSATLGSAFPLTIVGNFAGAPIPNTWYHVALGSSLAGVDLAPGTNDISASFNSNINGNPGCLGGTNWYYGFDQAGPAGTIDLLTVILHEIGHGLGFSSFVGPPSWVPPAPLPNDVWNFNLFDATFGANWTALSPARRAFSATNTGNLTWSGAAVNASTGGLTAGINAATGFIRMYAPNPYQPGSSVSHWDTVVTPNELMEPFITGSSQNVGLALPLMQDLGWGTNAPGYTQYAPLPGPAGNNTTITTAGGTAGNTTFLLFGTVPGVVPIPGCPGQNIGIGNWAILASGPPGANGDFNLTVFAGAGLAGSTFLFQSVELPSCAVTGVVSHTF